jgi:hypothetical protein
MSSTDPKPELTAKALMAQPVSQPAVYANGLKNEQSYTYTPPLCLVAGYGETFIFII